jgi:hypothetical protein
VVTDGWIPTCYTPKTRHGLLRRHGENVTPPGQAVTVARQPGRGMHAGIIGVLNLDSGVLTPMATGVGSTRGMAFVGGAGEEGE